MTEAAEPHVVALGIDLNDEAEHTIGHEITSGTIVHRHKSDRPPGVILSQLSGERLTADRSASSEVRGSGLPWPPEARVSNRDGSARLPLAMAWILLQHQHPSPWTWRFDEHERRCGAAEAIAHYAADLMRGMDPSLTYDQTTLVVPNALDMEAQEDLVRSLRAQGLRLRLLWRPVASALAWLEEFGERFKTVHADRHGKIGWIWCLHLGLESFELTRLDVRRVPSPAGGTILVPVRRLPDTPALVGIGLGLVAEATQRSVGVAGGADPANDWTLLWTTPWLRECLAGNGAPREDNRSSPLGYVIGGTEKAQMREMIGTLIHREYRDVAPDLPRNHLYRRFIDPSQLSDDPPTWCWPDHRLSEWIKVLGQESQAGLLGAVLTGPMNPAVVDGLPLSQVFRQKLLPKDVDLPCLIESVCGPDVSIAAHGAAIFGRRSALGLPTYFDTLPRLEAVVVRQGEPMWQDILGAVDRYVEGGKPWNHLANELGVGVAEEATYLTLTVWREGRRTVREVKTEFSHPVQHRTEVDLGIRMVPGQGNPRIEVIPRETDAFGGRRVILDWSVATDTGKSKQEALDAIPRTNPPLEPRLASLLMWKGGRYGGWYGRDRECEPAAECMRHVVDAPKQIKASEMNQLIKAAVKRIQATDPEYASRSIPDHATAVSSNGCANDEVRDKTLLDDFTTRLDRMLTDRKFSRKEIRDNILRALGYCSASTPNLMNAISVGLEVGLKSPEDVKQAHLVAMGNCIRTPELAMKLAKVVFHKFKDKPNEQHNDPMRALCRVLQYRKDACKLIPSELAAILSGYFLERMKKQIREGQAAFIYRHASLCIVYLLRCRRYPEKENYMDPQSELAEDIRATFRLAIKRHEAHKLRVIGGFVNLPLVTQMMIDYIDRQGKGRLQGMKPTE